MIFSVSQELVARNSNQTKFDERVNTPNKRREIESSVLESNESPDCRICKKTRSRISLGAGLGLETPILGEKIQSPKFDRFIREFSVYAIAQCQCWSDAKKHGMAGDGGREELVWIVMQTIARRRWPLSSRFLVRVGGRDFQERNWRNPLVV
jgi:hypothetical protein